MEDEQLEDQVVIQAGPEMGTRDHQSQSLSDDHEDAPIKTRRQPMRTVSKVAIAKSKGYRKMQKLNEKTGRKNQVLECLTC